MKLLYFLALGATKKFIRPVYKKLKFFKDK